jgi:hypothetical protein
MTEYPIHVQVALATGWQNLREYDGRWLAIKPGHKSESIIPAFDTSWCATGPLIEQYGIDIGFGSEWMAHKDGLVSIGNTPLSAVSGLLIQMRGTK